jgi:hypothetical protein
MANIYDVEGIDQFLPEPKKSLGSFLDDYATTAQEVSAPYVGMAGKYGFGDDPAKIQGLGSDVRHTTGSALGKFAIQDYLSQFGLQPSNPVSNFIGNTGIVGSTIAQELSDAVRGFRQAGLEGAINQPMEDVRANFRAMDIPYGTSVEDMVNMAVASSPSAYMANTPAEVQISKFNAPGPFNYGTAQAADTAANTGYNYGYSDPAVAVDTVEDLGFIDDAPQIKEAIYQDRIMNPNLPGFAFQPKESLRSIIGSQLQNVKTKAGQGFDFAKQLPGMALSAITGIPFAGQIAQGIGGLLGSVFQETPEQRNFRENIATDPEYQSLVSQIPGMSNYNQIFGMGSGRGLLGAIDKRLATLARTEKRQGVNFSETLKERRKKLEALRELERQKEAEFLESQRRGRRPGTGGDGGGGVRDSGGPTGGYSYDSGGRQGFGYGLRDGGLASLAHRRG